MGHTYLVTGSAGFIGFTLSRKLLAAGHTVVGLDNFNDYYSVSLKEDRNRLLGSEGGDRYKLVRASVEDRPVVDDLFREHDFKAVFHLAAQAGVRHSITHPWTYLRSNIDGTLSILEAARHFRPEANLLIASSSSVYGMTEAYPFREDDPADRPVALYGATKRADELMAHSYSHLFGVRTTLLRFFTVYGPWGRPDMALFQFTRGILRGDEIEVYNNGDMIRDFTYVDDIINGMIGLERSRTAPELPKYDIFNIGCSQPRTVMEFISAIEAAAGVKAKLKFAPFQPGDVYRTFADVTKLRNLTGYNPEVEVPEGVRRFVDWYRGYFKV
jgi:UDP-glucuronate 4-epimerase